MCILMLFNHRDKLTYDVRGILITAVLQSQIEIVYVTLNLYCPLMVNHSFRRYKVSVISLRRI